MRSDLKLIAARVDAPGPLTRDDAVRWMAELLLVLVSEAMPASSQPSRATNARLIRIAQGDFTEDTP